jgi:cell division protein ZipA
LDTKDLIIIAGSIFFTLIVAHGLWVARRGRMNDIRMDIKPGTSDTDDTDPPTSAELPNGGARVISQALATERGEAIDAPQRSNPAKAKAGTGAGDPEDGNPEDGNPEEGNLNPRKEPDSQGRESSDTEPYVSRAADKKTAVEPQIDDLFATDPSASGRGRGKDKDKDKDKEKTAGSRSRAGQATGGETSSRGNDTRTQRGEPKLEDLLILGVLAKNGSSFGGEELIAALRAQGLKFGDMGIFHRAEIQSGERLYSVANAVEPGTFDLSDLEALQTPGLTFFMQLPVPGDALETLDEMVLSARTVAATLGGDVKDDAMSALTGQTVEHMKQRIADFTRKQLTNANNP